MKKFYISLLSLIAVIVIVLLISWISWLVQSEKQMDIYVLDKTVPSKDRIEHKSFYWILNHLKFYNSGGQAYDYKTDYYGFFPLDGKSKDFDFKSIRITEVDEVSDNYDAVYYIDTYGVYYNEWFRSESTGAKKSSKVYGGLNQNDYLLLKAMKEKDKLILTEFNLYNAPTSGLIREKIEEQFGISWSGWYGKYFSSLDTAQKHSVPRWIVKLYLEQNQYNWPFEKAGIVLVHKYGTVSILEEGTHLNTPIPQLITESDFANKAGVPEDFYYTNWFDISSTDERNEVLSTFKLDVNDEGISLLQSYGLGNTFPAIVTHQGDYQFYYFGGNFANNKINYGHSYFSWIGRLSSSVKGNNPNNNSAFFWKYYYPLIDYILSDYQEK